MKVSNKEQMDKLSGNESVFTEVKEGEMRIRVVSDIEAVREHNFKLNGKHRAVACPTEQARMEIKAGIRQDLNVPPCPLCELGYPVKTTYLAKIVERETEKDGKFYGGEASVLKKGKTLLGEIQNLIDDENWGDPKNYDIKIVATGKNLERKYSILAIPADKCKPLNQREQLAVDELNEKADLTKMTTPRTYKEIADILGENFPDYETAKTSDVPF
jgi:hypothetical protein